MAERTGRVRVLILVAGLAIGQTGGGAERFGIELARHLDQEQFEPIVCAFWRRNLATEAQWTARLSENGIETFFAVTRGSRFTLGGYVSGLQEIVARLDGRPVDIIHSQFQLGTIAAIALRWRLGARAILRTAHGTVEREWENTLLGRTCRFVFTRCLFPLTLDVEVGVSESVTASMNRRLSARVSRKQTMLIYNGIPAAPRSTPDVREVARARLELLSSDLVIGSVGRLSEQKGYTYLLQALPAVLAHRPGCKIILIGDGELRASLETEASALGVIDSVTFLGGRPDVEQLYPAMDLFVLPSLWEGLPTVVLESMAAGVPVVATDIPGTREAVSAGHTGWLASPADPDSLASAILAALALPEERAARARAAMTETLPHYTLSAIADQYEALYGRLLMHKRK